MLPGTPARQLMKRNGPEGLHRAIRGRTFMTAPGSGLPPPLWGSIQHAERLSIDPPLIGQTHKEGLRRTPEGGGSPMTLSAPIFNLKRQAKLLARDRQIPLHDALDRIAASEGFRSWSHLAASASSERPVDRILGQLAAGDLLLLGARPGHGKTLLGLQLAAFASRIGRTGIFFTLEDNADSVADRFQALGIDSARMGPSLRIDTSDDICAGYVVDRVRKIDGAALAVIDYLQLLDQRRSTPVLAQQMRALKSFAQATGSIVVTISQIDRAFEHSGKPMPDLTDVRLPNPLDLSAFDKACFLHEGEIRLQAAA